MRFYSLAVPLIIASAGAIPTIPTLRPVAPATSGIVATAEGILYFVDSFHNTVWRVEPGKVLTPFITGQNGRALQVDAEGNIYGTHEDESGTVMLWRADCQGVVSEVSRTDVPEYGHAFVVEGDGDVIASSGSGKRTGVRLWRGVEHERHLLAGGEMGFRDGAGAEAQFFPIGSMTRTRSGDLLVTSGPTIRRVGADGSVRTVASGERLLQTRNAFLSRLLGDVQGHLTGIAIGERGEIYVANSARDAVVRISPDGTADEMVKSEDGWTPTGVATANGSLYILEYGPGVRVRRVATDGTLSVVAMIRPERILAAAIPLGRVPVSG